MSKKKQKDSYFFYHFCRYLTIPYFKLAHKLTVYGLENIPQQGGFLLAPNHASFMDPNAIGAFLPRAIHFLARASLFKPLFFGIFLRWVNVHPVRKSAELLTTVDQLLANGELVMIFPEGTRTKTGEMKKAEAGISVFARRSKVGIIPIYIAGSFEAFGPDRKFPKIGAPLTVIYGKPLSWEWLSGIGEKEIPAMVMEEIKKLKIEFESR